MNNSDITHQDKLPRADGYTRIHARTTSDNTTIKIDVNNEYVFVQSTITQNGKTKTLGSTVEQFNQAHKTHSYLDKEIQKINQENVKKENWFMHQIKAFISHLIEAQNVKKQLKKLAKDAKEQKINEEKTKKEAQQHMSVSEKIQAQFSELHQEIKFLDNIHVEDIQILKPRIIHALDTLQKDAITLTTFSQVELNQEAQSLSFNVLPNIISVYTKSMAFSNANTQALTAKLTIGLEELCNSISSLKEKHVAFEQEAGTQALDEALQFAKTRFSSQENESFIQTNESKNTKKLKNTL